MLLLHVGPLRTWTFLPLLLTVLTRSSGQEVFAKYDPETIKRFDDELRRLDVILPSLTVPDQPTEPPPPTVTAPAGDFEGYWTKSQFGRPIAAFEGIRYAQPPVGPLRFKIAEPAPRVTNFKATKPGSPCTQRHVYFKDAEISGQEDCLFINVYIPKKVQRAETERLPVMVFIHGGGFVEGWGSMYQSNVLLDKDVIFVSFNYRLGPLGFFTTEDGTIPGNLGLKDQVAALRWVQENIGAFGGDPNLVTLFGQSAGGVSTELHSLSPLSRGLLHRVIPMSGSAMAGWSLALPEDTRENQLKVAAHLRCPSEPTEDLLACLQTKSSEDITRLEFLFRGWARTLAIPFKPVIEGEIPGAFIPYHPKEMFANGPANDVPCMTGVLSEDGSFLSVGIFTNESALRELDERFNELAPKALYLTRPKEKSWNTLDTFRRVYFGPGPLQLSQVLKASYLFSDAWFFWPMVQSLHLRAESAKAPVFVYYLSYQRSHSKLLDSGFPGKYGASHGDEIPLVFPVEGRTPSSAEIWMSMVWTDLLTNFARDGVPSSSLIQTKWTPTTSTDIEYLHIRSPVNFTMETGLHPERWNLWKKLLEDDACIRDEI